MGGFQSEAVAMQILDKIQVCHMVH